MSANPATLPLPSSLKVGQAFIVGRIAEVKKTEQWVFTVIQTAAPDPYSHPGNHEVKSRRMIGRPGEEVRVRVQLGGFRRTFKDKHGESQVTVDNKLDVIED
jgi:hypothetical protein